MLTLLAAFAALAWPLVHAASFLIEGRYLVGAAVLIASIVWVSLCLRLIRWLLSGIEYSDL
ncbi:MAG TPA: hypothetical protein VGR78_13650 [Verrucomicrobiae bacterium]|nr:hypothetical protein [Verrucomicrobiae bacterium]